MDNGMSDSSVHGISQARNLEWVAIPAPENLPESEIKPGSCTGRQILYLVELIVKNLPGNAGNVRDTVSVSGLGRSPGREHGNPLQNSCQENPMDRGASRGYSPWDLNESNMMKRLSTQHRDIWQGL